MSPLSQAHPQLHTVSVYCALGTFVCGAWLFVVWYNCSSACIEKVNFVTVLGTVSRQELRDYYIK